MQKPSENTAVEQWCGCLQGQIALTGQHGLTLPSVHIPGQAAQPQASLLSASLCPALVASDCTKQ